MSVPSVAAIRTALTREQVNADKWRKIRKAKPVDSDRFLKSFA